MKIRPGKENPMADLDPAKTETGEERADLDQARRAALAKMGRFAGYTAPVMLGLLGATKVAADGNQPPPPTGSLSATPH
jgi:hypothetical protein